MNPDDQQSGHDFGASLPLPPSAQIPPGANEGNPAADLIRHKVEAAFVAEPDATTEALEIVQSGPGTKKSKHQQFIYNLTNSGKSLAEIQQAWHEYYAGLTDVEKHEVWQEFYSVNAQTSNYAAAQSSMAPQQELHYEEMPLSNHRGPYVPD
jgi:hypothetical protein